MLLLKTPHSMAAGKRDTNLKSIGKLPSCYLAFLVPEGAMQSVGGEKTSVVLSTAGLHIYTIILRKTCPLVQ